MNAGVELRRARREAGLSQRELAERAGVAQPAVARIERGGAVPRVDTLDRLLEACDRQLDVRPRLGTGIDRTPIAALLRLSPSERLRLAAREARNLARMERAIRQ